MVFLGRRIIVLVAEHVVRVDVRSVGIRRNAHNGSRCTQLPPIRHHLSVLVAIDFVFGKFLAALVLLFLFLNFVHKRQFV